MFAILRLSGHQYKVSAGEIFTVNRLTGIPGEKVEFTDVLMVTDTHTTKVGAPILDGAFVEAEILEHKQGDKVIIFKKRRRHNYKRKRGHRQQQTVLRVLQIVSPGMKSEKVEARGAKVAAPAPVKASKAAAPKAAPKAAAPAKTTAKPAAAKAAAPAKAPKAAEKPAAAKPAAAKKAPAKASAPKKA